MNFLHTFSLSLLMAAASLTAQAQFSIGPKIGFGPAYSSTKLSSLFGNENQSNFNGIIAQIGVTSTYDFNKNLALAADLTLSQLIADSHDEDDRDVSFPYNDTYPRYILLPIKIQGRIPIGTEEKFALFGNGGFYLGYLLNDPITFYGTSEINGQFTEVRLREGRKVDFGWNVGAGASYTLNKGILQASINYQRSALDFIQEDENPYFSIETYFSKATVQLAYLFQFGGTGVATYQGK